jgi:chromosome segregation ATPase
MPDPQLDDSIAHLTAFNGTLASQTPDLASAADELSAYAHKLEVAQHELRAELAVAVANVDALELEAATYSGAVESESESVGATALDEVDAALTAVDGTVPALQESVPQTLATRNDATERYLQELQEQGFDPLHQKANELARGAFGNWAAAAEEGLARLDQRVDAVVAELQKDEQSLMDESKWMVKNSDDSSWVAVEMSTRSVEAGLPAKVAEAPLATELASDQEAMRQEARAAADGLRAQLDQAARELDEQLSQRTTALVDAFGTVVDACEVTEHGAGEAEQEGAGAVPRASAVVDLFGEIEKAEVEVQQIQTTLQSMEPSWGP